MEFRMNRLRYSIKDLSLSICLLLLLTSASCSRDKNLYIKTVSGKKLDVSVLDNRIVQLMDSIKIPGLSIAIINNADIAYHRTFGLANKQTKEVVTKSSIFEAASLSKPLFAYFIMKMVEDGKLELDKPILPYLEAAISPAGLKQAIDSVSFDYYKTITPRMILCHSTGIPNWAKGKPIHIAFKPGTGYSYSGEAYQHLAAAFGTKLGIGWGSKLDSLFLKTVAHPLGMRSSFYTWNDILEKHKVKGHKNGVANLKIHRDKKVGPGYSLHSEASDYARFLIEMMTAKNIKQSSIKEMLKEQNHFTADSELFKETGQTGWGLGFAQKPTPNGLMHLHTGNNHDFQAYAMFVPDQKYGFALFANSDNLFPFLQALEKLIEGQF
jgi:CubicO group peptidase (beta-lactamase class C family)